jgi:hypothetical protein
MGKNKLQKRIEEMEAKKGIEIKKGSAEYKEIVKQVVEEGCGVYTKIFGFFTLISIFCIPLSFLIFVWVGFALGFKIFLSGNIGIISFSLLIKMFEKGKKQAIEDATNED